MAASSVSSHKRHGSPLSKLDDDAVDHTASQNLSLLQTATAILGLCSYLTVTFELAFNHDGTAAVACVYAIDGLFLLAVVCSYILHTKRARVQVKPALASSLSQPSWAPLSRWRWDVMSLLPTELLALAAPTSQSGLVAAILRLNRLLRLAHFTRMATALDNGVAPVAWTTMVAKFSTAIGLVVHTACCCWHMLACQQGRCRSTDSWRQTLETASTVDPQHDYISALYWAAATMTSTGYGDVHAVTVPEMWFAVLVMLIGRLRRLIQTDAD